LETPKHTARESASASSSGHHLDAASSGLAASPKLANGLRCPPLPDLPLNASCGLSVSSAAGARGASAAREPRGPEARSAGGWPAGPARSARVWPERSRGAKSDRGGEGAETAPLPYLDNMQIIVHCFRRLKRPENRRNPPKF
jgi:hypothetical protein